MQAAPLGITGAMTGNSTANFNHEYLPMEIHSLPVISTQHLTPEVASLLSKLGNHNDWCPCAAWPSGYFLSLDDLEARENEPPQCLVDLRDWLKSKNLTDVDSTGCRSTSCWLRLDSDGEVQPDLPVYEWE